MNTAEADGANRADGRQQPPIFPGARRQPPRRDAGQNNATYLHLL